MLIFTVFIAFASAYANIFDVSKLRRDLAPPAMTADDYAKLRACTQNTNDVASCFPLFHHEHNLDALSALGLPPIVLVPDCDESVHLICESAQGICSAHFAACQNSNASGSPNVELLGPRVGNSAYAVEAALPARQTAAGPYAHFVRALIAVGYIDKVTLRAAAWDAQSAHDGSVGETLRTLLEDDPRPHTRTLVVARGAGCALAVATAAHQRARAVLCLRAAPNPIPDASLHAHELGLMVRRRGRPLPVVPGPWGDGTLAGTDSNGMRCNVHAAQVNTGADGGAGIVLCAGDCKRWVKGAKNVDCYGSESRTDGAALAAQLECLARELLTIRTAS